MPPPDQLAAFYKLADKAAIAGVLCRHARHAELSASAAVQAEALFGDDSLVVVDLRIRETDALMSLAVEASGAERVAFMRWSLLTVLLLIIPVLLRRVEANTPLPGTIREEEVDCEARAQALVMKTQGVPVPPPAVLRDVVSTMGYVALLSAIFRSLDLMLASSCTAAQKGMLEVFVLQGLDIIPRTAGVDDSLLTGEEDLVAFVEENMNPHNCEPDFCAAFLCKWHSHAVSSVLQARGVLHTGIARAKHGRSRPGSVPTLQSTGCATAPFRPAPRRRKRSKSSRGASAVVLWCTAAWNIRR